LLLSLKTAENLFPVYNEILMTVFLRFEYKRLLHCTEDENESPSPLSLSLYLTLFCTAVWVLIHLLLYCQIQYAI